MGKIKIAVFSFLLIGLVPVTAFAATFSFSPSSGEFTGRSLVVSINVSSPDMPMNAASGVLSFPADKLEVSSIVKNDSVISLWVQEPAFSNTAGTVNFEGVVLNPGYSGSGGKVLTVNFRIKGSGSASLNMSSGSILANDGRGTNILSGTARASFTLGSTPQIPAEAPVSVPTTEVSSGLKISSSTHPDQNKWYAKKDAKFSWSLPSGTTGTRLLVDRNPKSVPVEVYEPAIGTMDVSNLDNGKWYIHVQLRDDNGWGEVSHFRFQIDTEKPGQFDMLEVKNSDPTEPRRKFIFNAKDAISGISYYEVWIDYENTQIWKDDGSRQYAAPLAGPGEHTLIAKAFDKAGNSLAGSAKFTVQPLIAPVITDYPKNLQDGDALAITGTADANSEVRIWLNKKGGNSRSFTAESDMDGRFIVTLDDNLEYGTYSLWAEVIDERGAVSLPTEKIALSVARPMILIGWNISVSFFSVIYLLIGILAALLIILGYRWRKFLIFKKKIRKEISGTEADLHRTFDSLKNNVRAQIKILESVSTRRKLTEEEDKISRQLSAHLDEAEKSIRKDMDEIGKELE